MGRRNASSSVSNNTRVRKISLQNEYAFGIISPVSATTLPVPIPVSRRTSGEMHIPCILVRPWQVERQRMSSICGSPVDIGFDPLSELPSSSPRDTCKLSTSSERFRRWSFSNLQSAFKATDPTGTEITTQFTSSEEDFMPSSRVNGSYTNLLIAKPGCNEDKWISEFITSIPERMRKLSSEKRPSNSETNIYFPDKDLKRQLKNMYVYWPK